MSTAELQARWEHACGRPAPKRASRDLLLRLVIYHLQEQTEGGLSKAIRRLLAKLGGVKGQVSQPPALPRRQDRQDFVDPDFDRLTVCADPGIPR